MKSKYIITLITCILFCFAIGFLGSIPIRSDYFVWYDSLNKSPLNPPRWIFPIAWGILYTLMGISLSIIISKRYIVLLDKKIVSENYIEKKTIKEKNKYFNISLFLFFLQIILNLLWSYLFFGFRSSFLGLTEIIVLDITLIITLIVFSKTSKTAAFLLIPYLIWILFATYLTAYIYIFN